MNPDIVHLTEGAPGSTYKCKVSSVLNRAADFKAHHMFSDDDYCWNSQGEEGHDSNTKDGQWLQIEFLGSESNVNIHSIHIMFQGGFVGSEGIVYTGNVKDSLEKCCVLENIKTIDDCNDMQVWEIPADCEAAQNTRFVRIVFPASTDFFGRVTIYRLKIFGSKAEG